MKDAAITVLQSASSTLDSTTGPSLTTSQLIARGLSGSSLDERAVTAMEKQAEACLRQAKASEKIAEVLIGVSQLRRPRYAAYLLLKIC